jgi:putative FmdB family regulatory protein
MPVYDYVCGACRHRFEVFRGLNEAGPHQCPLCEGPVTRAFAPPTILFRGSGWAKVDRRAATSAPAKATLPEKDGSGSGASTADASGAASATGSTSGSPAGSPAAGSSSGSTSGPAADRGPR